ncbi:ATP-binding protein [Stenotrophomonas sp. SG1]|uniref:ATP-binding protein n=1 Tax=Stenotrophomonas sp. SG1 TaxID=2944932 RepID=UPI00224492DE|nr:ATP-binding protein [Stenotrophomonas sp. SG1]MCW8341258.1 ATP-binding protein [Stenotrophomonas sp. SG1]
MAVRRLDPDHPLFIESGYRINTKPVERMADFVLYNIQQGHHGCSLYSESGVGKSTAQDYLVETDWRWLVEDGRRAGVARAIVATSDACRSPLSFWHALSHQLGMPRWSSARPHELRARIHNHMRAACGHADVRRYVLFIDSAQRLTNLEFQCLEDLDNLMSKDRLTLFLVFVYQSDQQGIELGDMWQHHPSHVVRRWFLDSAPFLPLAARDEVRHALSRYDGAAWWPTEDMPFSRYFATDAFDRGWRLESETEMICDAVSALRREVGLPEHSGWPMCSFTSTVRNLLTNAWFQQSFERLTPSDVRAALVHVGYLRTEFIRMREKMSDKAIAIIEKIQNTANQVGGSNE